MGISTDTHSWEWLGFAYDVGCRHRGCVLVHEYDPRQRAHVVAHRTPRGVASESVFGDRDLAPTHPADRQYVVKRRLSVTIRSDHDEDDRRSSWVGNMLEDLVK